MVLNQFKLSLSERLGIASDGCCDWFPEWRTERRSVHETTTRFCHQGLRTLNLQAKTKYLWPEVVIKMLECRAGQKVEENGFCVDRQ